MKQENKVCLQRLWHSTCENRKNGVVEPRCLRTGIPSEERSICKAKRKNTTRMVERNFQKKEDPNAGGGIK